MEFYFESGHCITLRERSALKSIFYEVFIFLQLAWTGGEEVRDLLGGFCNDSVVSVDGRVDRSEKDVTGTED